MPSGLTEAEYKKKLADEKNKKVQNKSRFPKGIAFLDMGAWVDARAEVHARRDARRGDAPQATATPPFPRAIRP